LQSAPYAYAISPHRRSDTNGAGRTTRRCDAPLGYEREGGVDEMDVIGQHREALRRRDTLPEGGAGAGRRRSVGGSDGCVPDGGWRQRRMDFGFQS